MALGCTVVLLFGISLSLLFGTTTSAAVFESGIIAHVIQRSHTPKHQTTVRRVVDGESVYASPEEDIELHCSIEGEHPAYSKLEWLDGRVPIRTNYDGLYSNTLSRGVVKNETCVASLIIHNLTIYDYGEYRCRCVNNYTSDSFPLQSQLYNSRSSTHTGPFCSNEEYLIRLLPKDYYNETNDITGEVFVTENHKAVDLSCGNLTNDNYSDVTVVVGWTKIDQEGTLVPLGIFNSSDASVRVAITTGEDQAKYICHDAKRTTVYAIQYISIKDHLQLPHMFIFPPSNSDNGHGVRRLTQQLKNKQGSSYPLCAFFPSSEIVVSKGNTSYSPEAYNSDDGVELAYGTNYLFMLELHPVPKANVMWIILRLYGSPHVNLLETIANELNGLYTCTTLDKKWQPSQNVTVELHLVTSVVDTQSVHTSELSCPPLLFHIPSTSPQMHSSSTLMMSASLQPLASSPLVPIPSVSPSTSLFLNSLEGFDMGNNSSSTFAKNPTTAHVESHKNQVAINSHNNNIIVLLPTLVVCLVVCTSAAGFCAILIRRRYKRSRRSGHLRMMNCKPTLANMLSRENPNQFPAVNFPAALPFGGEYDSGICVKEPISRQMANCLYKLRQSPLYFPYEKLEFKEKLGSGAFGVVKKALAYNIEPDKSSTIVAVKSLKDIASGEDEKDIISELTVLQHVGSHPNVVSLLGAAAHEGNLFVIVEYCARGSLLQFLRSSRPDKNGNRTTLSPGLLVSMATQVASGMEYLVSKNCIHRDLAARNVLITEDFALKVADFGLARKVYQSVYIPSGGRVPIKWMAPETILDQVYTNKSDTWSFGILLWEVMTLGRSPYPGMAPQCIMTDLKNGYRMPKPEGCPDEIYAVMQKCWQLDATERPDFTELISMLNTLQDNSLRQHIFGSQEMPLLDAIVLELKSTNATSLDNFSEKRHSHNCSNGLSEYDSYISTSESHYQETLFHRSEPSQCAPILCEHNHYHQRSTWKQTLNYFDDSAISSQCNTSGQSMESLCKTCKSVTEQERNFLRWSSVPNLYADPLCDSAVTQYENCTTDKEIQLQLGCVGNSQESVCSDCKKMTGVMSDKLSYINVGNCSLDRPLGASFSPTDSDTPDKLLTSCTGRSRISPRTRPTQLILVESTEDSHSPECGSSNDSGLCSSTSEKRFFIDTNDLPNGGYLPLVGNQGTGQ